MLGACYHHPRLSYIKPIKIIYQAQIQSIKLFEDKIKKILLSEKKTKRKKNKTLLCLECYMSICTMNMSCLLLLIFYVYIF